MCFPKDGSQKGGSGKKIQCLQNFGSEDILNPPATASYLLDLAARSREFLKKVSN